MEIVVVWVTTVIQVCLSFRSMQIHAVDLVDAISGVSQLVWVLVNFSFVRALSAASVWPKLARPSEYSRPVRAI